MARRRRNRNPLNVLTLLLLAASLGVVCVFGLLLANPGLLVGDTDDLVTVTALVIPPTDTPPVSFPTLPPEWTATSPPPGLPSLTPDLFPTATSQRATAGTAATSLPDLNSTAEAGIDGQVSADVTFLRVRALAGTAGEVIGGLDALTPVQIIGRSTESDWLEILGPGESAEEPLRGWVMTQFVDVFINLAAVPVTAGAVLDATPTLVNFDARVSDNGDNLRLRQSPGTAGFIQAFLPAGMILDLVGRTADNVWVQVVTSDNQRGWVMVQFLEMRINLELLPVTGTPVNASAEPTGQPAAGAPPAATQVAVVTPTSPPAVTLPPTALPPTATHTPPPPPPTNTQAPPPSGGGAPLPGEWVFGISEHARQIFQAGQALGNRANVFSKVGDSITVSPQFLSPIGYNQYDLRGYTQFAEVVDFFKGGWARTANSFANTSLAAKGGWSTFSVLAPSLADRTYCYPTELPLACEYRLTKPAVALIMLGTNDVLGTHNDAYVANLRRIVGDTIGAGIIPVLSTIPPFIRAGHEARADEINNLIVAVAQENDIPVWNYWAALQGLPNRGMGPDGVHPAWAPNATDFTAENLQYGSTMRNLTALMVLDAVWRQAMN